MILPDAWQIILSCRLLLEACMVKEGFLFHILEEVFKELY